MTVGLEDTEQLLARLEAELKEKQAKVDERRAREQVRIDALTTEAAAFTAQAAKAQAELGVLIPRREALAGELDALRRQGSKGSPPHAALWATVAVALTAGATISLAVIGNPGLVCPVAGFGGIAVAVGWLVSDLVARWRQ